MSSPLPRADPSELLTDGLLKIRARKDMSKAQREILLDAANALAWDDAIHVAAPWERRSSLCGKWNRNLVDLGDDLRAAAWFDSQSKEATA